ncbi:MBL fold metallo-hydrolase [Sphingomonas hankookensis]|uniref:MBL fold metallo-hydrolase n=1 Tax=Sphingomonas hankookensis TaxID=563996 RepID=A0ABR5YH71_9SPHN|nr:MULTISPECIES: N-acyl homoserine lactonase family protein [Sphingomonas]KZE17849.1 MBL fold metallo-hydrolase [Sphingomonas hankookensis]PZT96010.1 MAG: N-acyl homoserine lactonase family protein [Sphingomonas sp.]RSV25055.1 N-acyl homoserine lactonase family protein [Sphingomonas sp. ABOLH]WCP73578.1 N-acyl homoserine lactonase family protein [Sphingomonas hankookensis]
MARLAALAALVLTMAQAPAPKPAADVELWRLDCGGVQVNDLNAFSDTLAYSGQSKRLVASCYLIRHGSDYMLWDTGLPEAVIGQPVSNTDAMSPILTTTIKRQLAQIGVKPEQIGRVGISHYHFDHTGQAAGFPGATLLIGKGDADALSAGKPGTSAEPLKPWFGGGAKIEAIDADKDVFGDGSVTLLNLPGHTPGHHALLVVLKGKGPVLLSGDLAHFRENYDTNGVPPFNTDRAATLASLDRFKKLAGNVKATVILQHEPGDVAKLPAFPASAR